MDNSGSSITPADLAAAALEPWDGSVRADRQTTAALVTASAIQALISEGDTNFGNDAGALADAVVDVNDSEQDLALNMAGRTRVIQAALGTISEAAESDNSPILSGTLIAADEAIGKALEGDAFLESPSSLPNDGLMAMLQNAILGINGTRGEAQAVAPEAAAAFVEGLISAGVPDGESDADFAVAILKKVSKNTSVDELVAYQVGLKEEANQADLVSLATALFAQYPKAVAKVTQGISAAVPAGDPTEAGRIAFAEALAMAEVGDAAAIAQGAVFVDPLNAGGITQGVLDALLAAPNGSKLLVEDAGKVASAVGSALSGDGDELTEVAETFAELTGSDDLPVTQAAAYARDLIRGAMHGTISGAGFINAGRSIQATDGMLTPMAAADLASIVDVLADGIVTADAFTLNNSAGLKKAASEVGALVAAVVRMTGNESFDTSNGLQELAPYLAGTLADSIAGLDLTSTEQEVFFMAITKGVAAVSDDEVDKQVTEAVAMYRSYPAIGAITVVETNITNL